MVRSTPTSFGQLLRHHRDAAGLTQDALAERAGISSRAIIYLERDARVPFPDTIHRLAAALELTKSDLSRLLAAARSRPDEPADLVAAPVAGLPWPLTSLVGRNQDAAEVRALLARPGVRLVTLTGTGGVGKSRLAIQVATEAAGVFTDGVRFVALAGVREPGSVVPAIAQALGVREAGDIPLGARLTGYLRERRILLLLDNFEQVGSAAPEVATLLAACPDLVVLVTSRASLHVQGEYEWPVLPLAVPAPKQVLTLEALGQVSAVALFVQRGQAIKPDFALTEANAPGIAAICRELDGLPLALELAAARLKVLSPGALLSKLVRRLALLTGGTLDLPERQRTLRSAIAWSYELLEAEEQQLFRRLAVFAGGAGLEAVETICGAEGACAEAVVDGLGALIDHSLVQVSVGGGGSEPRYGLLETVRDYGLEQLEAAGETLAVRDRHLAWCITLAETAACAPRGLEQRAALDHLEEERDNLRAALAWSTREDAGDADGRPEQALRLATALVPFWEARGPLSEGRRRLEAALAAGVSAAVVLRLRALTAAGRLATGQCDFAAARHWFGESLTGYRAVGDRQSVATALTSLGQASLMSGQGPPDRAQAVPLFEEALVLCRELGDEAGIARALNGLANVAIMRGESKAAGALLDESLSLQRDLKDTLGIVETLHRLGDCVLDQGDTARATQLFDERLAQARGLGDTIAIAGALLSRGEVAMRRGEFAEAEALMAESLVLYRKVDATGWMAAAFERLGVLAAWQGHFEEAADRLGECLTLLRSSGKNADYVASLSLLCWITSCQGAHERAVLLAKESLAILRDIDAWGLAFLAGAWYASGDEIQGRLLFLESLDLVLHEWTTRPGQITWCGRLAIVYDLAGLARIAAARGQPQRSVKLYGASEACRATAPFPLAPPEAEMRDCVLVAARAALDESTFATAWTTGQTMPLNEAIAFALKDEDSAIP